MSTTGTSSTGTTPDARPVDPAEAIPVLRERIDDLDAQIANLVRSRAEVSRRIQAARIQGGGTRIELGRERVVLQGYRDVLGPDGALLGDAVLRVCRGAR
jgi:chorismate mutase